MNYDLKWISSLVGLAFRYYFQGVIFLVGGSIDFMDEMMSFCVLAAHDNLNRVPRYRDVGYIHYPNRRHFYGIK